MKVLVVFILIAIGVFLFRRAQRLAKEEQEAMMAKKSAEKTIETSASPVATESAPEVVSPAAQTPGEVPTATKTPEVELMPRELVQSSRVEMSEDVIDVEIPASTNGDSVIILGDTNSVNGKEVEITPVVSLKDKVSVVKATEVKNDAVAESVKSKESVASTHEAVSTSLAKDEILESPGTWANVTLQRAVEEYQGAETELARYNALQNVIAECYKQRKSTEYLAYGAALHAHYLALFHSANAKKTNELELKTTGFMQLATLLNDTQAFAQAIALCQEAIALGLSDGTVTGFEGRISRILKAQAKAATV